MQSRGYGSLMMTMAWTGMGWLMFAGCDSVSSRSSHDSETTPTSTSKSHHEDIVIFTTCDTNGWIEPCGCASGQSGGLSRRASLIQSLTESRPALTLSCGGAARGESPYDQEKLIAILQGEAAMGYRVHNVGVTEFQAGIGEVIERLRDSSNDSQLEFISTNTSELGDSVKRSVLISIGGWELLVMGVMSPTIAESSNLENVKVLPMKRAVLNEIRRIEKASDRGVDAIILLAYADREELSALADELPEVDIVLGGHTGQSVAPVGSGTRLLTAVSSKGKFVARVVGKANGDDSGKSKPKLSWSGDLHEVTSDFEEDPLQVENLTAFRGRLATIDFAADQTGFVDSGLSVPRDGSEFVGSAACQSCHRQDFKVWEKSKHSHAWATLQDKGAHVDSDCQRCHTTGYGMPGGFVRRASATSMQRSTWVARAATVPHRLTLPTSRSRRPGERAKPVSDVTTTKIARCLSTLLIGNVLFTETTRRTRNPSDDPDLSIRTDCVWPTGRDDACFGRRELEQRLAGHHGNRQGGRPSTGAGEV